MSDSNVTLIITFFVSLISVALGAWLSPYVSSVMERKKIKRELKPELLKNVVELLRLRRAVTQTHNTERLHSVSAHITYNELKKVGRDLERSMKLNREYDILRKEIDDLSEMTNKILLRMINIETNVVFTLSQVEQYSKKLYKPLMSLLMPYIDKGDIEELVIFKTHFESLTYVDHNEMSALIKMYHDDYRKKSLELQHEINAVFKYE